MRIVKLKTRVHGVPGIETLTMQMLAGRRNDFDEWPAGHDEMSTFELQAPVYSSKDDALAAMSAISPTNAAKAMDYYPWRLHSIWGGAGRLSIADGLHLPALAERAAAAGRLTDVTAPQRN